MSERAFFDVPRSKRDTSAGPVELPILYYDASLVQAFFWRPADAVAPRLAGTGLEPAVFRGGKALVGVVFFEYRDTSVGPYNEAGVAVAVRPEGARPWPPPSLDLLRGAARRTLGFYITDLPVTTRTACRAGRELWGFPKFVTEIPVKLEPGRFECAVKDPATGAVVCSLEGPAGGGPALPALSLVLYSNHEGAILRTVVDVRARAVTRLGRGARLGVGPSDHPMARALRDLGLDGATPVATQVAPRFQSRLPLGAPIALRQAPPTPYGDA